MSGIVNSVAVWGILAPNRQFGKSRGPASLDVVPPVKEPASTLGYDRQYGLNQLGAGQTPVHAVLHEISRTQGRLRLTLSQQPANGLFNRDGYSAQGLATNIE